MAEDCFERSRPATECSDHAGRACHLLHAQLTMGHAPLGAVRRHRSAGRSSPVTESRGAVRDRPATSQAGGIAPIRPTTGSRLRLRSVPRRAYYVPSTARTGGQWRVMAGHDFSLLTWDFAQNAWSDAFWVHALQAGGRGFESHQLHSKIVGQRVCLSQRLAMSLPT